MLNKILALLTACISLVACAGSGGGDFEIVSEPKGIVGDYGNYFITGQVRNVSGRNFDYVPITCEIYRGDVQLANAVDNSTGLLKDKIWRYRALVFEDLPSGNYSISCDVSGF